MLKQKIELECYISSDKEKAIILKFQQQLLKQISRMELQVPVKVFLEKEQHLLLEDGMKEERVHKLQDLLSRREFEVFELHCENYSTQKMSKALHISEHTVKKHIQNIKKKLGVNATGMDLVYQLKELRR